MNLENLLPLAEKLEAAYYSLGGQRVDLIIQQESCPLLWEAHPGLECFFYADLKTVCVTLRKIREFSGTLNVPEEEAFVSILSHELGHSLNFQPYEKTAVARLAEEERAWANAALLVSSCGLEEYLSHKIQGNCLATYHQAVAAAARRQQLEEFSRYVRQTLG